jgi:hypothetical protein
MCPVVVSASKSGALLPNLNFFCPIPVAALSIIDQSVNAGDSSQELDVENTGGGGLVFIDEAVSGIVPNTSMMPMRLPAILATAPQMDSYLTLRSYHMQAFSGGGYAIRPKLLNLICVGSSESHPIGGGGNFPHGGKSGLQGQSWELGMKRDFGMQGLGCGAHAVGNGRPHEGNGTT